MTEQALPKAVIVEDHRLQRAVDHASLALAKHRWHWTLNERNAKRVSMREYARQVGRDYKVIHKYAHGYAIHKADADIGISEAIERASMGAETETAAEAVAQARGVALTTARQEYPTEVRRVREIARQRAEEKGTSVHAEAPKIAKLVVAAEKSEKRETEKRKGRRSAGYITVENSLVQMLHHGKQALQKSIDAGLDKEEVELLQATLDNIRSLLALIDKALTGKGTAGIDWDTELEVLMRRGG